MRSAHERIVPCCHPASVQRNDIGYDETVCSQPLTFAWQVLQTLRPHMADFAAVTAYVATQVAGNHICKFVIALCRRVTVCWFGFTPSVRLQWQFSEYPCYFAWPSFCACRCWAWIGLQLTNWRYSMRASWGIGPKHLPASSRRPGGLCCCRTAALPHGRVEHMTAWLSATKGTVAQWCVDNITYHAGMVAA